LLGSQNLKLFLDGESREVRPGESLQFLLDPARAT
jgi:hypothetical protein